MNWCLLTSLTLSCPYWFIQIGLYKSENSDGKDSDTSTRFVFTRRVGFPPCIHPLICVHSSCSQNGGASKKMEVKEKKCASAESSGNSGGGGGGGGGGELLPFS